MKIGVSGAGNIGATLARKLVACGHEVKLANSKGPESLQNLVSEIGAHAVTKEEAVSEVGVVILSIPFPKYPDLKQTLKNVPEKVVVIDTSNYYPGRDGAIIEVDDGKPVNVWVSEQFSRPVIKLGTPSLQRLLPTIGNQLDLRHALAYM